MGARRLRWSIALTVFIVGCCSEEPGKTPAAPGASASTASASASASDEEVPHRRLLGKWGYNEPTKAQLTELERRSKSIHERDRLLRAARELSKVTKTYTKDRRRMDFGGIKPILHRYEVLELDDHSVTLRLSPIDGVGKPFEEKLEFVGDDKMVEVVNGVRRELSRM